MRASEIIEKKKKGESLSLQELEWFLKSFMSGALPDYQMTAWLMAVCWRGMDSREQTDWTHLMWKSGKSIPRTSTGDYWIDKHSTGGVGDKTSLILVPLLRTITDACLGKGQVKFPMISGRGLGHTGGTLDKLESVPGFSCRLSLQQSSKLLEQHGFFMVGQTDEIAPADRRIYALRDATSTVDSIPLIISSILSKKLAESLNGIVFDVKVGSGAFMKNQSDANELAKGLVAASKHQGLEAVALVTDMNTPIGNSIGNSVEVWECWEFLKGKRDPELEQLVIALGSHMLSLASKGKYNLKSCETLLLDSLSTAACQRTFVEMFENQNGDWHQFEETMARGSAQHEEIIFRAPQSGLFLSCDALKIGKWVHQRGGGRNTASDAIDPWVGAILLKKCGEKVEKDEPVARVRLKKGDWNEQTERQLADAFQWTVQPISKKPLIHEVIV